MTIIYIYAFSYSNVLIRLVTYGFANSWICNVHRHIYVCVSIYTYVYINIYLTIYGFSDKVSISSYGNVLCQIAWYRYFSKRSCYNANISWICVKFKSNNGVLIWSMVCILFLVIYGIHIRETSCCKAGISRVYVKFDNDKMILM